MSDRGEQFKRVIEAYEKRVFDPKSQASVKDLIDVINGVGEACAQTGLAESGTSATLREHWYTRLAAAITAFASDPDTKINMADLREICRRKQSIAYIFSASGYRSTSHILTLMSEREGDGRQTIRPDRAAVLLAMLGIDDVTQPLMDLALTQSPEMLFVLTLGWLNQRAILTAQGERNRTTLLSSGELFASHEIQAADIPQLVNAWMYCTYASTPGKHAIKDTFNAQIATLLNKSGVSSTPRRYRKTKKPRLVVIHERFRNQHAMFRCYLPIIKQLRTYFEMIAIADEEQIDSAADVLFDEVIRFPKPRPSVQDIAKQVEALKPDMVYYPSLGMSHWVVLLATLRLAPVQIMTHGHPATSRMPTIDYVYTFHMEGDTSKIVTETHIMGPRELDFAAHSDAPPELPNLVAPSDREVRVAVHAKVMKLSYRLIDICNQVTKKATVPVQFTFFPGERGLFYDGLEPAIRARVPNATVAPYMNYRPFLDALSRCDLAFASFPFGNTNSTVDTCLMGLPTVAHFGPEGPAQTDAAVLRTAGFPEWLITRTDQEYLDLALRLINEPELRARVTQQMSRTITRERLFNFAPDADGDKVAEIFYKLYLNHERLAASDQRVYDYKDILALPA